MTKTLTAVDSYHIANPSLPEAVPFGATADGSFVRNFEFGSLGFVWDLVFGAWHFQNLPVLI